MSRLLDWSARPCGACKPGPGDLEPWHIGMCDGCYLQHVDRAYEMRRKEQEIPSILFNVQTLRFEGVIGLMAGERK